MAEKKSFKVEIDGDILAAVRQAFERKKLGYWDGTEALFRWFIEQDAMVQRLILGQVEDDYRADIARIVLSRIAGVSTSTLPEPSSVHHLQPVPRPPPDEPPKRRGKSK